CRRVSRIRMLEHYLLLLPAIRHAFGGEGLTRRCGVRFFVANQQMKGKSMRKLSVSLLSIVATVAIMLSTSRAVRAQGTVFIYTGQLSDGNGPVNGTYDLMFTLYGASTGGSAIAGPQTNAATIVNNGEYTVALDFGAAFDGSPRWLEIAAQTNGGAGFATL